MDIATRTTARSGPAAGSGSATRVAWRDVAAFVLLAYGLAWAVWGPVMGDARHAVATGSTPSSYLAPSFAVVGMFAPAIAAVIMRVWVSKEGLPGRSGRSAARSAGTRWPSLALRCSSRRPWRSAARRG
jgi:uncharacterized protein